MKYSIALAGVLIALMGPASATEYLTNGGFETGDFSGWDLVDLPNAVDDIVASDNPLLGLHYGAQSGDWYLVNSTLDFSMLSQTFTDTQGQLLTVSGWTIGDEHTPGGLGEISYFFNGVLLGSPTVTGTWTQATFSVTATGSDTFEIDFEDVPSLMGLDSFSVSSGGLSSTRDAPEPSTWAMMLIGLIGLGLFTTPAREALFRRVLEA